MRILAIRGAHLASLDAPFEVDLASEPLRSAGVFAIVGPTGAGKSSLLDALCLALFDTTPRLERTPRTRIDDDATLDLSARDARTLVRRGAKDAFAEVDLVGVDGATYRARWFVERGRTGRLRATQLSLRDLASGRAVAGTKGEVLAAIEAKLGLGLAELRRAVLLPQGEVAAFLDAPSDERAQLLERLTGAEIFAEVSKVVHARAADARRARENVEITSAMLSLLDPTELARLEGEVASARLDAARAEERAAELVAQRDGHVALARLREEEQEARHTLAELEAQRALAELGRDEIALADRVEPIRAELAEERRATLVEQEACARHEAAEQAHEAALAALGPLRAARVAAATERDRIEAVSASERDVRARALADARAGWAALAEASERDAREAEMLRARERELARLARATDRLAAAQAAARQAALDARTSAAQASASAARTATLDARALELALDATAQSARLEEATRAHERALVARSLDAHRAHLVDGEACPLCGATEHRVGALGAIDSVAHEAERRAATIRLALERTRATLVHVQSALRELRRDLGAAEQRERAAQAASAEAHAQAEAARAELRAGAALVGQSDDVSALEEAIRAALADADVRARALEAASARERSARAALSALETRAREQDARAEAAGAAARGALEACVRAEEIAAERARTLDETRQRDGAALGQARVALAATCARTERALSAIGVTRADAERVLGRDQERIRRTRADLRSLDDARMQARARVEERALRRAAHEQAMAQHAELDAVLSQHRWEALDTAITRARAQRDAAHRRGALAEATLAHDRAVRERAAELKQACDRALVEEARWAGLDDLVGAADGKRFRAYAQSLTLERLVAFANAELAHLAPRFSLVRAPTAGELALAIVDRESGGARRSVQSLSGGESFLVSLALALGLAAMTAADGGRGSLRASSLFLDEGLGALDPGSLEIALGALETLRASGRQIAIVTHVPQVAERFSARVEVVPRGAGRSDVRVLRA